MVITPRPWLFFPDWWKANCDPHTKILSRVIFHWWTDPLSWGQEGPRFVGWRVRTVLFSVLIPTKKSQAEVFRAVQGGRARKVGRLADAHGIGLADLSRKTILAQAPDDLLDIVKKNRRYGPLRIQSGARAWIQFCARTNNPDGPRKLIKQTRS